MFEQNWYNYSMFWFVFGTFDKSLSPIVVWKAGANYDKEKDAKNNLHLWLIKPPICTWETSSISFWAPYLSASETQSIITYMSYIGHHFVYSKKSGYSLTLHRQEYETKCHINSFPPVELQRNIFIDNWRNIFSKSGVSLPKLVMGHVSVCQYIFHNVLYIGNTSVPRQTYWLAAEMGQGHPACGGSWPAGQWHNIISG